MLRERTKISWVGLFFISSAILALSALPSIAGSSSNNSPFSGVPNSAIPENTEILQEMRERLLISKLAKARDREELKRRERVRAGLSGAIELNNSDTPERGEGEAVEGLVSSRTLKSENSSSQEKTRNFQRLVFKQAFLKYRAQQRGIGSMSEKDLRVLTALLCRSEASFQGMAAYRSELVSEFGTGPLKNAASSICQ